MPRKAVASTLTDISRQLARLGDELRFASPVATVYNPLRYAWRPHREFLRRYGGLGDVDGTRTLLVGMNPGPWGMAQTGIPFGAVPWVRDWLALRDRRVGQPADVHPKKPVAGFACARNEVSGDRLWGWAAERFGSPEKFFNRFWVTNFCPLLFLDAGGRNLTPDRIPAADREPLLQACDRALRAIVQATGAGLVVGIGNFAARRAELACEGLTVRCGRILHPSPASPAANRDWKGTIERQLRQQSVEI